MIGRCQGLFLPILSSAEKSPGNEVVPGIQYAICQCQSSIARLVHRGWRSKSGQIYTKTFNSNSGKDLSRQVPIAKHDCTIRAGVELRISRNVKRKTVHFSINGREQSVSTCSSRELDIFYGFVRLRCEDNDREIQVTLVPAITDEGTNSC